jgi:hypothetical protein
MHTFDPLYVSSDLPGVNPATLIGMILYYHLMTNWSGLGDSTKLYRMGLSHKERRRVCYCHLGFSSSSLRSSFLVIKGFQGAYMA